ncbi:MAG: hypothetical protein IKL68_02570 [Clostridia bacterium]|nr:hypothetical protein [Clostridia bacterium]
MLQRNVINGIKMLGSVEFEGSTYYLDVNDNIYLYDKPNSRLALVKDTVLINKILDMLEAKPIDIVFGG